MKDLGRLITEIEEIHTRLQASAASAVNQAITVRNWLIGHHIVEFEQGGADRAEYGANLLDTVSSSINIKGLSASDLSRCRQFYLIYPQILGSVTQNFGRQLPDHILGSLTQESSGTEKPKAELCVSPEKLLGRLSFTHFTELIKIENPLKRTFYELECIKGTWSVRELKRQISSLYFERSGLSAKPDSLSGLVQQCVSPQSPKDIIRNIYAFEFLGLPMKDAVEENDNPPVGILLVAEKDHALVRYTTAGMDENLFVQEYMLQLPSVNELQAYLGTELRSLL